MPMCPFPMCPMTHVPNHPCPPSRSMHYYAHMSHHPCAPSHMYPIAHVPTPMGHIGIIVHGSRWGTEVMGHMDDGAHGHNNVNSSIETNVTHS